MKTLLLNLLLFFSTGSLFAQDTTWVQTFTFDSIATRRASFAFPSELNDMRFEKVLMYYKLKCSPLTPWDSYNCGEWDYLAYTRIFDHTGEFDSVQVDSTNYLANYSAPSIYNYNPDGYTQVDSYSRIEDYRTGVPTIFNSVIPIADGTSSLPFNVQKQGGRYQMLISAVELGNAGFLTNGNFQALSLYVSSIEGTGTIINPTIRIKQTSDNELLEFHSTGFTEVYNSSRGGSGTFGNLTVGENEFLFFEPFFWNGSSNIIVEFTFDDPSVHNHSILFDTKSIVGNTALNYGVKNGVLNFDGASKALLQLSDFDLGAAFTIAFWAKGTGSTGQNTSILEAYDTLNNRVINIHFPWSNNRMYFDAGKGSGYDRIDIDMPLADIDDNWNHWAFTKDAVAGEMKIYRNGVLFHSGTGKNAELGEIHRLVLGQNSNGNYPWIGKLDEFQLFDIALDESTIAANYNKKATSHPAFLNLIAYYDFDEEEYAIDRSNNSNYLMPSKYEMFDFSEMPQAGVEQAQNVPVFGLSMSSDIGTLNQEVVTYEKKKEPQVVFYFTEVDNHFEINNAHLALPSGSETVYDENGAEVSSVAFDGAWAINKETITYYEEAFELINDVEIGRFITPYGISFDLGANGFSWVYDVTDYQQYLKDVVDLAAHNTQELIDLKFAFIEGIPPRDVHNRQPIWRDFGSFRYDALDNDDVMQATTVDLADSSSMFKIKTRFTGHGHEGADGLPHCCEWSSKDHYISVDGTPTFQWEIWEETACGDNPNIGQGGTWPYAREGWCPGDLVKEYDHELTPHVIPGTSVEIDYDIEDVPTSNPLQGGGNYVVAMDLISYGAPNFQHDAAIIDVLNPNNWEYYRKWNPSCLNPRVILQNTGEQPLTSCIIRVWNTYENWVEYEWNGNLEFLEKEMVEIPVNEIGFWNDLEEIQTFHAQVYAVEGYPDLDEYPNNNLKKVQYEAPDVAYGDVVFWMRTNNKASENRYRLEDAAGNIILDRSSLTNNTDYKDTLPLEPGCYSLTIEDFDSDGLSFWYSNSVEGETAGFFKVRDLAGGYIELVDPDFGNYHQYNFSVGFAVNIDELAIEPKIEIYPNPNVGEFEVELRGEHDEAIIEIFDLSGRNIMTQKMLQNKYMVTSTVDIRDQSPGPYIVKISTSTGIYTDRIIKN